MAHTVVVDGTEITVGGQTTVATLRKVAEIPPKTTAFYRTDDVIHLLHDTDPVAAQVPEGAVVEFHPGPIGPETELETDDTQCSETEDDTE